MRDPKRFNVYIMTNRPRGVLYVGLTSNLIGRVAQHREGRFPGFTDKYNCRRLVWFESHDYPDGAIAREKRIKRWRRDWKIDLVEESNPRWLDLSWDILPHACSPRLF